MSMISAQTLRNQQARAEVRAVEQRADYRLTWSHPRYTVKATGRSFVVPICTVTKRDGSGEYQVVFRPQGVPQCSCPQGQKNAGTRFLCKHALICLKDKREREGVAGQPPARTAEAVAQAIADRRLWD